MVSMFLDSLHVAKLRDLEKDSSPSLDSGMKSSTSDTVAVLASIAVLSVRYRKGTDKHIHAYPNVGFIDNNYWLLRVATALVNGHAATA